MKASSFHHGSISRNVYLNPVLERYNNTYMQRELVFKAPLEDAEFASDQTNTRFNNIRNINRRQLDQYMLSDVITSTVYDDLYGDWFEILEATTRPLT